MYINTYIYIIAINKMSRAAKRKVFYIHIYEYIYICIYIFVHVSKHTYTYIYTYTHYKNHGDK